MKCTNCGEYSRDGLKFCPQCGNAFNFGNEDKVHMEQVIYKCSNCGATISYFAGVIPAICPYCRIAFGVNKEIIKNDFQIDGVLSFIIDRNSAINKFNEWLSTGFWRPHDMKKLTELTSLTPIFVPVWLFSTHTKTNWSGRSGMERSRQKAEKDSSGNTEYKTEYYIDWFPVSGIHENLYPYIPVPASKTLIQHISKMKRYNGTASSIIDGYDYQSITTFDSMYIEKYPIDSNIITLDEAKPYFTTKVRELEKQACTNMISGDKTELEYYNIIMSDIEYKLIYVPMYLSSFYYDGKLYSFIVNGRTAKISSEKKPISVAKILIAIMMFIVLMVLIVHFV
jgi:hypothetical protein